MDMFKLFGDKTKSNETVRPRKKISHNPKLYELHKEAKRTLGSGNLRLAVKLPEREDLNEWLAVNTVDFFNQINLLYGSITEFCTPKECPVMSAGPKYEYLWMDEELRKPVKCSAPDYIDHLMTWIQNKLDNETIFPSRTDVPFPKNFQDCIKTIFKRLFRVYAHIYYCHFHRIVCLGEEAHLNTCFKHFYYFISEFKLVGESDMDPLADLIANLTTKDSKEEKKPNKAERKD